MSSVRKAGEISISVHVYAALSGDRVCRVRGMQAKLRFWVSFGDPLRRSCVSSARNGSEIVFLGELGRSAELARVECAECR